ncbi:MAG: hypothetical protein HC782_04170 [Gammaproteobacteria bacterium]|nr:hypothetical protein [Gammaproteobacteria bacterium]
MADLPHRAHRPGADVGLPQPRVAAADDRDRPGALLQRSRHRIWKKAKTSGNVLELVDVTADWCITCQVNKTAVMTRGEVAARLADGSVSPLRADWTRPDPAIARYLASFGRYGIHRVEDFYASWTLDSEGARKLAEGRPLRKVRDSNDKLLAARGGGLSGGLGEPVLHSRAPRGCSSVG